MIHTATEILRHVMAEEIINEYYIICEKEEGIIVKTLYGWMRGAGDLCSFKSPD